MSYEPTTWARGTKITATKLNNIEQGVQSVNSEYTPTTWAEGDIVTATKLNNIEQGIANASGGGGDFSTAEVTIINHTYNTLMEQIPTCFEADEMAIGVPALCAPYNPNGYPVGETTIKVPLYKGKAMFIPGTAPADMTGNIEQPGMLILITGNGSITWDVEQ